MGRKSEIKRFFEENSELFDSSRKRLFVDLYATGNFSDRIYAPQIDDRGVPKEVMDQLLVMKREDTLGFSEYVHILPLIDINNGREQITSTEMTNLLFNTSPEHSLLVLPHAHHDYLSGDFWEQERNCINHHTYMNQESPRCVVYPKKHIKYLAHLYGYHSMPFIHTNRKSYLEKVCLKNARESVFSALFSSNLDDVIPIQKYRVLRQITDSKRISALNIYTMREILKAGEREETVFYEYPYDYAKAVKDRGEYGRLKQEAAQICESFSSIQGSLF